MFLSIEDRDGDEFQISDDAYTAPEAHLSFVVHPLDADVNYGASVFEAHLNRDQVRQVRDALTKYLESE